MRATLVSMALAVRGARRLGGSDLVVSEACLGTMTWGVQNNQEDANEQLDYARDFGINFIDTAELYPVPLTAPEWRAGTTEEILGNYLKKIGSAARDELVVATKVAGFFPNSPVAAQRSVPPITDGPLPDCRLDSQSVNTACDASLRRLQTDRIDLLQIHWPDRYLPVFGQLQFDHDKKREGEIPIIETASAFRDLIEAGKVRYIGLSNESPYGVAEWIKATEALGIRDKLVSIQNSYSLLDRRFEADLAESCARYNIGLLPWSVLAGGLLSGKYASQTAGPKSRFIKYPEYMSRWSPATATPETLQAVDDYVKIAEQANLSPSQLAIAYVRSRRFVSDLGSVIVGATTLEQLKENLEPFHDAHSPKLDSTVVDAINKIHMRCRDPSCSL
ncbi:gated potassium channel subunit beta [Seminavis robusta]|uniref:Gated potassium channel subunit beta n=1 Tax=Seminavis robusta TaxID=568900 RepID=A0A9N8DDA7_9STRA|nr:gated potassium channel subunit beta [Seminavis robusta]|eukprot:Sro42_g025440.1 gated potassium channel subunit beta (390) ;mRNA; f:23535-24704